jgi:phospholipase C
MRKFYFLLLLGLVLSVCAVSQKIKNVVVLMEENRSFDHMFGWYPGVNGLTGREWNPVDTTVPNSRRIYVDKLQPMIAPCDPDHGTTATTYKIFGAKAVERGDFTNASMIGFVEWEGHNGNANTNYCAVMSMLTPNHIPVLSSLAANFALMDHAFAAHAGPTWPNRLFMLSATSAGLTETGPWYRDQVGRLFPQKTIFDQLTEEGLTWRNYYNDTPWELFLSAIAHHPENLASMDQFFADARNGKLPAFSWINPRSGINVTLKLGSNDQHPDHDIALGEQYYKDIYEALRASPQWNQTLLVITYDEHGGYYDHVPTPLNVPPPGDGESSYPEKGVLFNRLGVRLPFLLISPWIPKGIVVSKPPAPQKPANNSEYDLTSIIATTRKLLGMRSGPLTHRDAWAATFEHVLSLKEPRTDCPLHLPPAPPPSLSYSPEREARMPPNDLQKHLLTIHAHLSGKEYPAHLTAQGQVSEWMQDQFRIHAEQTKQWKASKAHPTASGYALLCGPAAASDWADQHWNVNAGKSVRYNTVSLRKLSHLCLDYGSAKPKVGGLVGVANCYPSANPDTNRDPAQQWYWRDDATVRPAADPSLCLTTSLLENDPRMRLQRCSGGVEQHWAWHGPAPGEGDGGDIFLGDDTNGLGVKTV